MAHASSSDAKYCFGRKTEQLYALSQLSHVRNTANRGPDWTDAGERGNLGGPGKL